MKEQASKALEMAVESYQKRKKENRKTYIPSHVSDSMVGFSTESVKEALGGSNIFKITKGIIKNDILVLSGGCTSSVMQYSGLTSPDASEEAGEDLKTVCKQLGIPPVLSYGACVDIGVPPKVPNTNKIRIKKSIKA